MTGKTHKAIGVATGVALVIYSIRTSNMMYALGLATAPFGAMLPDIDHDRSKLGAVRKRVTEVIHVAAIIVLVLSVLFGVVYDFYLHKGEYTAIKCLMYIVPICLVVLLADSTKMKEKSTFLRRHRGIMHTLVVPVLLWLMTVSINIDICTGLLIGLLLGYLSHLFADTLTLMGAPLAYPLSKKLISIGTIRTGTAMEYIIGTILCVVIIFLGTRDISSKELFVGLYIILSYAVAYVIPETFGKVLRRGSKVGIVLNSVLLPVGLIIVLIAFGLVVGDVGYCLLSACVGLLMTNIKSKKKNH